MKSAADLQAMKGRQLIAMLTAYTYPVAKALNQTDIPVILVGDSVAMVELGLPSTREITMDNMQYHIAAVRRGAPDVHIIGDMPIQSDSDPDTALHNAQLLVAAGANSVKLEGAKCDVIRYLTHHKILVAGHTGLTPQTATSFKQVGGDDKTARIIVQHAKDIATAGAFMLVLEHIPSSLAAEITEAIAIPTIGIGAGRHCDGQVMVINDLIGMGDHWPLFSTQYVYVGQIIEESAKRFHREVTAGIFPPRSQK